MLNQNGMYSNFSKSMYLQLKQSRLLAFPLFVMFSIGNIYELVGWINSRGRFKFFTFQMFLLYFGLFYFLKYLNFDLT